jgi:PTH2 family peptidyl-tRNA hydrolase
MSDRIAKQVIVMRTDLGMRKGKMVAQGAHASIGAFMLIGIGDYSADVKRAFHEWVSGAFTKICVCVDTADELLSIYGEALDAELPVKLITDSGRTEFHGHPTITCLAIGPAWSDDIDPITGHLRLL